MTAPTLFDPQPEIEPEIECDALLSECGQYRYTLTRIWDRSKPLVVFSMLNPSTADALINDPTIVRCIGFARAWGYGGIIVVNLFAWRATDPAELTRCDDPIGPDNDAHLFAASEGRDVVAAWGASVPHYWRHRPGAIAAQLRDRSVRLHHLGLTKDGHPRHPLYLRGDTTPTRWVA